MRLIILDTETTGLSPAEGRIVEIAAVEMLDGKLTGREFHHLLNPEHPISECITEIIGRRIQVRSATKMNPVTGG